MCRMACEINPGCPRAQPPQIPRFETGRFSNILEAEQQQRLAAKPKLQRRQSRPKPRKDRRNIDRKPLSVGEALGHRKLG